MGKFLFTASQNLLTHSNSLGASEWALTRCVVNQIVEMDGSVYNQILATDVSPNLIETLSFVGSGQYVGRKYQIAADMWVDTPGFVATMQFRLTGVAGAQAHVDSHTLTNSRSRYHSTIVMSSSFVGSGGVFLFIPSIGDINSGDVVNVANVSFAEVSSGPIPYIETAGTANSGTPDYVSLMPEWDYRDARRRIEESTRSRSGKLTRYKYGDRREITLRDTHVPYASAIKVNSWWRAGVPVVLQDDLTLEVVTGYITNKAAPASKFNEPYSDQAEVVIELETY